MPYGKSNKSIQDSAFKMRSGNSTPFKQMGSSPLNKVNEAGKWVKTKHQKKLIRNYDEHKNDPSYQKALTGAFGGKTTYDSKTGMVSIEKGAPDKSSSPATFKSSPAKQRPNTQDTYEVEQAHPRTPADTTGKAAWMRNPKNLENFLSENPNEMSFGAAFSAARKAGKKEFTFKGKQYTTKLKNE